MLGPAAGRERTGLLSFVIEGEEMAQVAHRLDREYGIAVRSGMHCSPLAHQSAGTLESGAVRASVGVSTTREDVETMVNAMKEMFGRR
ncbi:putative cysteine desulfurase [compost metagenome]